ncbi:MAG TPA: SHOCT domain-containing protein [Candidatus Binatia bacterium]|nr:SHOCT domain-containing protein [Candidatus Binatia bacterium]
MKSLSFKAIILLPLWLASVVLLPVASLAQGAPQEKQQTVQLLFVQNSTGVVIDKTGRVLTLKGLSPTTLYFSDRPVRLAGHYRTAEYLKFWKDGPDSFLKDPPNATLSVFEKGKDDLVDVVVTLRNPRLKGNELSYDIKVIDGKLPRAGGPATLFIDIIGMPWTPFSFAGMARRAAYRTVLYDTAATSAAAAAAASAYYRPPVYVTPAPAPATVIVTPPPPPPTVVTAPPASSQTSAVARLKELKSMLNQGLITQSQYQEESQKILNQLTE